MIEANVDDLKREFNELKTAVTSPRIYLTNYLTDLRNRIDLCFEICSQQQEPNSNNRQNQILMIAELDSFEKRALQNGQLREELTVDIMDLEQDLASTDSFDEKQISALYYRIYKKFLEVEKIVLDSVLEEIIFIGIDEFQSLIGFQDDEYQEKRMLESFGVLVVLKGTFVSQKRMALER